MCEQKRVLCIVSIMDAGGAETFLMKIYRNLNRKHFQMDFCVNEKREGLYDKEIRSLGGKIYVVPSKSENPILFKCGLKKIIMYNKYHYVLRITSNAMGFWDLKIAKQCGVKRCIARSSNSSDGGSLKTRIAHAIGKKLYDKYVDVKIAPSDLAAIYTFGDKEYKSGRVNILNNAIDLNRYCYSIDNRIKIRNEFQVSDSTTIIGHIGRFTRQKNHIYLLEIFKEFHNITPDSKLVLVGRGELEEDIIEKARNLNILEHIIFTGVRSDIPAILSAMDVFVFPSLYEGMPNTVVEAQATGLPCIIADTITQQADIAGGVSYMSLDDSPRKWAQAVLLANKTDRRDVRNEFVNKGYDIKTVTRQFEKLIFGQD